MHEPAARLRGPPLWCREAVVYRLDVRSFRDSDGDSVGDFNGVRERMGYLELLGADIVTLAGVLASPLGEVGKGRDVDPILGGLEPFQACVDDMHARGFRLTIDTPVNRYAIAEPDAYDEIETSFKFWMDCGIDAFTVGLTPGMLYPLGPDESSAISTVRPIIDSYPDRGMGGVVDHRFPAAPGLYGLDVASDSRLRETGFNADELRGTIESVLTNFSLAPTRPGWTLADWKIARPASRYGSGEVGLTRARAMGLLELALPGAITLDNGDELGIPDSVWSYSAGKHVDHGRIPWDVSGPTLGFSDAPTSPAEPVTAAELTVQRQLDDPDSTLSLFRRAIDIRKRYHRNADDDTLEWYGAPQGCLAFRRRNTGFACALNTTNSDVPLPPGDVILASAPIGGSYLPPDTAAWLAV